jgi:hypothetical protein
MKNVDDILVRKHQGRRLIEVRRHTWDFRLKSYFGGGGGGEVGEFMFLLKPMCEYLITIKLIKESLVLNAVGRRSRVW